MPRRPLLSAASLLLCLSLWPQIAAAQETRPCGERRVGSRQVDGATVHIFRIRPDRGSRCQFNMSFGDNVMARELRVVTPPKKGKLVSAKPNRIVYAAGTDGAEEVFVLGLHFNSIHGDGWGYVAVQVQPR